MSDREQKSRQYTNSEIDVGRLAGPKARSKRSRSLISFASGFEGSLNLAGRRSSLRFVASEGMTLAGCRNGWHGVRAINEEISSGFSHPFCLFM